MEEPGHSTDDVMHGPAMEALLETTQALSNTLELIDVMQAAVSGACYVTGLQTGAIYTLAGDTLHLQATEPPLPPGFPDELLNAPLGDHPHIRSCLESGYPVRVIDIGDEAMTSAEREVCEARHLESIMYVPIPGNDGARGVFIVGSTDDTNRLEGADESRVRMLADHISLAIESAQLHKALSQANVHRQHVLEDALEGWANALEARDSVTSDHSVRTQELTVQLAVRMDHSAQELEHIRRGVMLHDIGKIVVPDTILMKEGPLSESEWEVMQRHPGVARDFMSGIDFLAPAVDIPYYHHERWDGSGYPCRLSGENIPLPARIFAVVDVYDALTSDRPYREAWSHDKAVEHIRNQSGSHFDPAVVEKFLTMLTEAE